MKYKVRRGDNGFINYHEPTTFTRITYTFSSGMIYLFDVAFHYILAMTFTITWYLLYLTYSQFFLVGF